MKRTVIALTFGMVALGCTVLASQDAKEQQANDHSTTFTNTPVLTPSNALAIADAEAARQGYEPKEYPKRQPRYDANDDAWSIFYLHEPDRWPGDHFRIEVNDKTQKVRFIGGR